MTPWPELDLHCLALQACLPALHLARPRASGVRVRGICLASGHCNRTHLRPCYWGTSNTATNKAPQEKCANNKILRAPALMAQIQHHPMHHQRIPRDGPPPSSKVICLTPSAILPLVHLSKVHQQKAPHRPQGVSPWPILSPSGNSNLWITRLHSAARPCRHCTRSHFCGGTF